jgi:outer membrane PBP1 activator LpoA protein
MLDISQPVLEELIDCIRNFSAVVDRISQLIEPDPELTNKQACELLGLTHQTLNARINDGTFKPGYHFSGNGKNRIWFQAKLSFWKRNQSNPTMLAADYRQWVKDNRSR